MSPQAGAVLMEQIAPRLKAVVPHIKPVGCEDHEELLQDGLTMAAKMLHDLEARGKTVTPGNIVWYIGLHLKSGRRSYGCGRSDAMFSSTQLDGKASVMSLEEEVGFDPETMEAIHLGDLLTYSTDDAAQRAGRNLDWDQFIDGHDYRFGVILRDIIHEKPALDVARDTGVTYNSVRMLRKKLAAELKEYLGADAVADSAKSPAWKADVMAGRERAACKRH